MSTLAYRKTSEAEVVALLLNPSAQKRLKAVRQLAKIKASSSKTVSALARTLRDPDAKVAVGAARALGSMSSRSAPALKALEAMMVDEDAPNALRIASANALSNMGTAAAPAFDSCARLLMEGPVWLRQAAGATLKEIGPRSIPMLLAALPRSPKSVSYPLCCLARHLVPRLQELSGVLRTTKNSAVRETILEVFEAMSHKAEPALPVMCEMLRDPKVHPRVRHAAVQATHAVCEQVGPRAEVMQSLLKSLSELGTGTHNFFDEQYMVWGLKAQGLSAIPGLLELLEHQKAGVRQVAVHALGEFSEHEGFPLAALRKALNDTSVGVRKAAARALKELNETPEPDLVDSVITQLKSSDVIERINAASALGKQGAEHPKAIDALLTALDDPRDMVIDVAARALGAIGPASLKAVEHLTAMVNQPLRGFRPDDHFGAAPQEQAAKALGKIQCATPEVLTALSERVAKLPAEQREARVWHEALSSLIRLGYQSQDTTDVLLLALKSRIRSVRQQAVETLPKFPSTGDKVLVAITSALKDRAPEVRREAAKSLRGYGTAAGIAERQLEKNLARAEGYELAWCAEALLGIDPANAAALDAMYRGLDDSVASMSILSSLRDKPSGVAPIRKALMAALSDAKRPVSSRAEIATLLVRAGERSDKLYDLLLKFAAVPYGRDGVSIYPLRPPEGISFRAKLRVAEALSVLAREWPRKERAAAARSVLRELANDDSPDLKTIRRKLTALADSADKAAGM